MSLRLTVVCFELFYKLQSPVLDKSFLRPHNDKVNRELFLYWFPLRSCVGFSTLVNTLNFLC